MARWPDSGSPGTLCMATKVAVAMNQTVMTPCRSRLRVYCHIMLTSPLFCLRLYPGIGEVALGAEDPTQYALDARVCGIYPAPFVITDESRILVDDLLRFRKGLHAHLLVQ